MVDKARDYIKRLQLEPHPEGGYFKEIYRSGEIFEAEHLPGRYNGDRSFSTSIYFMLAGNQFSSFHKLKSDELWHYYDGVSVKIYVLSAEGELSTITLGRELNKGERLQAVIEKGSWFGAELTDKDSFVLIGCTVSPGFDFRDFELGNREELIARFPQHEELIIKLTKSR